MVGGAVQLVDGKPVEPVEHEERAGGAAGQPRAASLAPVPAPAGHATVIAPDDLSGQNLLDVGAVAGGIERLATRRHAQVERAFQAVGILAPEWHDVADADRVVEINERVDAR